MRILLLRGLILLLVWTPAAVAVHPKLDVLPRTNTPEQMNKPYVVLISIDGYRYDYTDKYEAATLKAFREQGSWASSMIPIFPSLTFPNHYAIATGLYADKHGLISNSFYDFTRGQAYNFRESSKVSDGHWYGGEPLWVAAEKQGMLTATFFWVGSEADIQGIRPTYSYRHDGKIPHEHRVQQILEWLQLPPPKRPHFITLHLGDVDKAGHKFGPNSEAVKQAVQKVDATIGKLLKGISQLPYDVNVVIVSDHGMELTFEDKIEYLDDYVSLDGFQVFNQGPLASLYTANKALVAPTYEKLRQAKHVKVYTPKTLPQDYHYARSPRVGDLIAVAELPWLIGTKSWQAKHHKGQHGWDPQRYKTMHGIFYAQGPQIKAGQQLEPFRNIHVYPFIMKLLGLRLLTPIDGDAARLSPLLIKRP